MPARRRSWHAATSERGRPAVPGRWSSLASRSFGRLLDLDRERSRAERNGPRRGQLQARFRRMPRPDRRRHPARDSRQRVRDRPAVPGRWSSLASRSFGRPPELESGEIAACAKRLEASQLQVRSGRMPRPDRRRHPARDSRQRVRDRPAVPERRSSLASRPSGRPPELESGEIAACAKRLEASQLQVRSGRMPRPDRRRHPARDSRQPARDRPAVPGRRWPLASRPVRLPNLNREIAARVKRPKAWPTASPLQADAEARLSSPSCSRPAATGARSSRSPRAAFASRFATVRPPSELESGEMVACTPRSAASCAWAPWRTTAGIDSRLEANGSRGVAFRERTARDFACNPRASRSSSSRG